MAVTGMVNFLSSVDRYLIMSDIGIPDDSKFELMAQDAIRIDGTPEGNLPNPRPLYREDIVIIFHMCTSRDLCHDD